MKKNWVNRVTIILLVLLTVYSSLSYIFLKQDTKVYSKGAAASSVLVLRSLEEFETLIEKEKDDYTYYNNVAAGFVPSLNYHIYTSEQFVAKYKDYYWETTPIRDSIRKAAHNFTQVNDKESYEEAKKVFKQELEKYREAVNELRELDGLI